MLQQGSSPSTWYDSSKFYSSHHGTPEVGAADQLKPVGERGTVGGVTGSLPPAVGVPRALMHEFHLAVLDKTFSEKKTAQRFSPISDLALGTNAFCLLSDGGS